MSTYKLRYLIIFPHMEYQIGFVKFMKCSVVRVILVIPGRIEEWDKEDPIVVLEEGRNDHAVEIKREKREGEIDVIVWLWLNRRQNNLTTMVNISLMTFS